MDIAQKDVMLLVRYASTSIVALLLLAMAAAPLVAACSQHLAKARERIFYDKFAKQIGQMGLVFGLCTLPFTGGVWAVMYLQHPIAKISNLSHPFLSLPALLPIYLYMVGLLLLSIYASNWGRWKGKRFVQSLFGWCSWLCMLASVAGLLLLKRTMNVYPDAFAVDPSLESYFSAVQSIPLLSSVWPFLAMTILGGLGAAGVLGAVYCLTRRDKEDYGRDYYAFALKAAAWWGMVGCLLGGLGTGGYVYMVMHRVPGELQHLAVQAGLASASLQVITALAMLTVATSATPLRKKATPIIGAVCLVLAAVGLGMLVSELYTLF